VVTTGGERLVGASSSATKRDSEHGDDDLKIAEKFRALSEDYLGSKRANAILENLWKLENMKSVALLPPAFVIV
jgi:hypothetical protein